MNWTGDERFTFRDIDEAPELRHYFDFRPERGDFGFVAEEVGAIVGIVWLLFLPADHPGYGFVAEGVPELSVGVWPGYRGRGVGERLMRQALAEARRRGLERVSLSVEPENPALHLYRKLGFVPVEGGADGTCILEL
jgi:ribosomal protein S18 acetylase RimI-like enzyme